MSIIILAVLALLLGAFAAAALRIITNKIILSFKIFSSHPFLALPLIMVLFYVMLVILGMPFFDPIRHPPVNYALIGGWFLEIFVIYDIPMLRRIVAHYRKYGWR